MKNDLTNVKLYFMPNVSPLNNTSLLESPTICLLHIITTHQS